MDEGSGLVRRAVLTPANVNESVVADALPLGDEAAVYADKGYDSAAGGRCSPSGASSTASCGAATRAGR